MQSIQTRSPLPSLIVEKVNAAIKDANGPVAMIVQPPARRAVAGLLKQRAARALVLSINELPPTQPVEVVAVIGQEPQPATGLPAPVAESDASQAVPQGASA
jgi:flagellar biosynthesis protein FlhA